MPREWERELGIGIGAKCQHPKNTIPEMWVAPSESLHRKELAENKVF